MRKTILFSFCIVFVLFSCAEKKKKKQFSIQGSPTEALKSSWNNVVITAGDDMMFNLKEIKVKPNVSMRLTLKHTGRASKQAMGHNFVLLAKGVDLDAFAQKAFVAADNDYIPEKTNEVIAYTKLLGGGESDTIKFQVPDSGVYEFICSFPGHFSLMRGKFIVE